MRLPLFGLLLWASTGFAQGSLADPRLITAVTELSSALGNAGSAAGRSVESRECEQKSDCHASSVCEQGRCVTGSTAAPGPQASRSLRRRGSEIYLRARMVELREELALGRGPVIKGLARAEGVPAKELGRTLRAHHLELVALIGDGSSTDWSARFLTRVDELSRS